MRDHGAHLILSGGPAHDFAATTAVLAEIGSAHGLDATIVESPREWIAGVEATPERWDVITCNALFWTMTQERYRGLRESLAYELSDADAAVLHDYVDGGGSLLAMHTAVICGDAHPVWQSMLGASWNWENSSHPPPQPVTVTSSAATEPSFVVEDELYQGLDVDPAVEPEYYGSIGDGSWPVVWRQRRGRGRVVTNLLGHDATSLRHPEHRKLIADAVSWLTADRETGPPLVAEEHASDR